LPRGLIDHPSDFFLSAIAILEIEAGVLMRQRRDKAQGAILQVGR